MMGAAVNTVISFLLLDILSNAALAKYYQIPYEYLKLVRLFIFAVLLFIITNLSNQMGLTIRVLIKLSSIILFLVLVISIRYFTKKELVLIRGAFKKWVNPAVWKNEIKKFLG